MPGSLARVNVYAAMGGQVFGMVAESIGNQALGRDTSLQSIGSIDSMRSQNWESDARPRLFLQNHSNVIEPIGHDDVGFAIPVKIANRHVNGSGRPDWQN
jgi:hypothetical protein